MIEVGQLSPRLGTRCTRRSVLPFGKLVPAPESREGQIQFQNLVAMWLSRRRDNRKISQPCWVWHKLSADF
jgi:hypothetical protein